MENYKFSTLPYQRPDLEARRTQLARWQDAVEQAESFDALRALLFEMDRANGELSTQCAVAHIRHTLDTRDAFYEAEIHYLQDTLPTLGAAEVALSEAIASSPFRPDVEREFGRQYFVAIDLQKKQFCDANEPRLEEIWDELIRIRNQMGKNLGYENYIPLGYLEQGRTDYGEKEVASFREQVRTVLVPLCQKLYDAQAKRLGIDHVMWHDEKMVFPDGNAEPAGDAEFMVETARKMPATM